MATNLSDQKIYFLESEDDDWITDHAGDPDAIDLDGFSGEGVDWCKLEMPKMWKKSFGTGMVIVDSGGGYSFQERDNKRFYALLAEGILTSRANGDLVEQFFTNNRHTAAAEATYIQYYMIVRFAASDYVNFTDHVGNRKEYCKGSVLTGDLVWNHLTPQAFLVRLNFRSVWNDL